AAAVGGRARPPRSAGGACGPADRRPAARGAGVGAGSGRERDGRAAQPARRAGSEPARHVPSRPPAIVRLVRPAAERAGRGRGPCFERRGVIVVRGAVPRPPRAVLAAALVAGGQSGPAPGAAGGGAPGATAGAGTRQAACAAATGGGLVLRRGRPRPPG